jgi:hypothetical protein
LSISWLVFALSLIAAAAAGNGLLAFVFCCINKHLIAMKARSDKAVIFKIQ